MQLKRLEAYGFKSFADKIELEFHQGITAIVGPNGSGKSNITDAIRWVLGEQNIRNLRGAKAEDIIFTGSASRKALGIAEVSLFFENNGELPIDYKEVVVTRRLFRSGESEFYLNRSRCRLKDIYNLFADTGIGHDGMSIIGQNRIDDILNSKPEERRAFFEETSGITKYRNRKKESLRKLEDMEGNLLRVNDIIHEVESQLEPFAKHAEKTRQYNLLTEDLKKYQLTGFSQKYAKLKTQEEKNNSSLQEVADQAVASEAEAGYMESLREQLDKEALDLELSAQAQADKNEKIRVQADKIETELAMLKERSHQSGVAKERILRQRESLQGELHKNSEEIRRFTEQKIQLEKDLELAGQLLESEQEKVASVEGSLREKKQEENELAQICNQLKLELTEKQKTLAVLARDLETSSEDASSEKISREEIESRLLELQNVLANFQQQEQDLDKTLEATAIQDKNLREELRVLLTHMQTIKQELDARFQELQTKSNRLKFLKGMQQAYEGFGKAAKAVLKSDMPWRKGVCGAVGELLSVSPQYVIAVEVALGGNMQNIVTEDTATAKSVISFLKEKHLGRITFLPLSEIVVRPFEKGRISQEPGVIGYANELVEAEVKYKKVADFLLNHTLVMDTLDHALLLAKKMNYKLRIVTLDGELLHPGGSLSGGSRQHKEISFMNRGGEIKEIQMQMDSLEEKCRSLKARHDEGEKKQTSLSDQSAVLVKELHDLQVHQAELRITIEKTKEELEDRKEALYELEEKANSRKVAFQELREKKEELSQSSVSDKEAIMEKEAEIDSVHNSLQALEEDAAHLAAYINDRKVQYAVLKQNIQHNQESLLAEQQKKEQCEAALAGNHQEELALSRDMEKSISRKDELVKIDTELQRQYAEGKEMQNSLYEQRLKKLEESKKQENLAKEAMRKLNLLRDNMHQLELKKSKISYLMEECEGRMLSEYGLTPECAVEESLDLPEEEIQEKVSELNRKIRAIGPVNPNAIQQYEELKKRYDFMSKQANDLTEAKGNLLSILKEIDDTMTQKFKEAFAQIQIYFGEIFVRLFGGGKAELKLLDEDDVLHSGIDILVQIPQKKQQNLSALSGGERALTVVALLFSFLKYKPSPFSVLDEIDAPLDEANVSRFGNFLKEFSNNTQFVVVTHRKGTMEAVDMMYGVTIEDAGVSKILSVKMDNLNG